MKYTKMQDFRVLTDNGSNMVAAFKNRVQDQINFEDDDYPVYPKQSSINLDPESSDNTNENTNESTNNVHLDEISDSGADSDVEIDGEQDASTEISNFEQQEDEHTLAFKCYKRISCFIHTLQLVVKIFETAPSFKASLQKAYSIVRKVNKSTKATEKLIEKAKKNLSVIVLLGGILPTT